MARSYDVNPVIILKIFFTGFFARGVFFVPTDTTCVSCEGYKLKINKLEPCDSNNIVLFTDKPNVVLTPIEKDCFATFYGCGELAKDIKSCKVMYDVKKRGMMVPFKGEKDVCEEIDKQCKDPKVKKKLKAAKIDPHCPVSHFKVCSKDDKANITEFCSKFRLAAGQYSGTVTGNCDSGKSCFKFDIEFKRGK